MSVRSSPISPSGIRAASRCTRSTSPGSWTNSRRMTPSSPATWAPTVWAARYLTMNGKRRLLGSFNHGSMANAPPQAIGAQVSHPGRQVISMSGDGGFAMLMGDLLTLRQHQLPVKLIVFRNDSLAFVALDMKDSSVVDFGTDLHNPDFTTIAEGARLLGLRDETTD